MIYNFIFNFLGPHIVEWEARTSSEKTVRSLHRDVERGGVKVDTGMDEKSGYLISRQFFILVAKNTKDIMISIYSYAHSNLLFHCLDLLPRPCPLEAP